MKIITASVIACVFLAGCNTNVIHQNGFGSTSPDIVEIDEYLLKIESSDFKSELRNLTNLTGLDLSYQVGPLTHFKKGVLTGDPEFIAIALSDSLPVNTYLSGKTLIVEEIEETVLSVDAVENKFSAPCIVKKGSLEENLKRLSTEFSAKQIVWLYEKNAMVTVEANIEANSYSDCIDKIIKSFQRAGVQFKAQNTKNAIVIIGR